MTFLCVDIGGTNTLIGIGNRDFEEVERLKTREFLSNVEQNLEKIISSAEYSKNKIKEVAVAAAGPMDRKKGVFYPPNLSSDPELDEVQLKGPLEKFGDLQIINDCTAAALGEYHYGETAEDMVYITISSGIGLGAIFNGEIIEGSDGNFGEIGHMKVNGDMECGCGGKGHWEAYCSGNRLPEMASELFDAEFQDAIDIFESYRNGCSQAEKAINKMQEVNAEALVNVINIYNPKKVVLGGPVALNHHDIVIEDIIENIDKESVNRLPEIVPAELEDQSVLHGLRAVCANP